VDDDISVEDFAGYLDIVCTSLYKKTQACSSLCTQVRHALELDCSNGMGTGADDHTVCGQLTFGRSWPYHHLLYHRFNFDFSTITSKYSLAVAVDVTI
jgi:hypothetical protein